MQRLSFILFQLDEARRYILDGRPQHLRLAFLVLDNAAEIQMDRRIRQDMESHDMRESLRNSLLRDVARRPHETMPTSLQEIIDWRPLTPSQKRKIDRFHEDKLTYLVDNGGLDVTVAAALKHLHKYRNEAYHRAHIRPGTIRPATLILFEINCEMLLSLYPGPKMWGGDEDYSWIKERFDYDFFFDRKQLPSIVDQLRLELLPSEEAVATALADHLRDRLSQLDESLAFIVENSGRANTKEEALRLCQQHEDPPTPPVQRHSLESLSYLQTRISQVSGANGRMEAFARFAALESEMEPLEKCVDHIVFKIDDAIQSAIDIARGK